jgi:hypothetical protein
MVGSLMIDELEGSDGGLIDVQPWHFPGGAEENYGNLRHDTWCQLRFELSTT